MPIRRHKVVILSRLLHRAILVATVIIADATQIKSEKSQPHRKV